MSVKLMGQVYELQLGHAQQSIALALADHGHDDGSHIFPGNEYLAWKTGYSERNVIRLLQDLETIGLLVPVNGQSIGRGNRQEYFMDIPAIPKKPSFDRWKTMSKGDRTSCLIKGDILSKGDKSDIEKVTSQHLKGDKSDTRPYITYPRAFEPSIEPSIEPSESTAAFASDAESKPQTDSQTSTQNLKVETSRSPTTKPEKPKPKPRIEYSHGSLVSLDEPAHVAARRCCNVGAAATLEKKRSVEEATRDLMADGATADDFTRFQTNWWRYKCHGAYHGKAPTAKDLRDFWDEVLRADEIHAAKNEQVKNGQNQQPRLSTRAANDDAALQRFKAEMGIVTEEPNFNGHAYDSAGTAGGSEADSIQALCRSLTTPTYC